MTAKKSSPFNFEQSLEKLNKLVDKMEQGNLPLEESLKAFEQGVTLIQDCQQALKSAEQKIKILSQSGDRDLKDFDVKNNDD